MVIISKKRNALVYFDLSIMKSDKNNPKIFNFHVRNMGLKIGINRFYQSNKLGHSLIQKHEFVRLALKVLALLIEIIEIL